jgi:protein involved in polysaccharide export with SLBB domain
MMNDRCSQSAVPRGPGVLVFCAILAVTAAAQTVKVPPTFDLQDETRSSARTTMVAPQTPPVAYESVVDPQRYYVGPSDQIAVSVWAMPPIMQILAVSPEGTLIIPTVGEVRVADLTLAQAKEKVVGEIRKKYLTGQVSVTLVQPRSIVVMVTGSVLYPGLYTLTAVDRAHRAIEKANQGQTRELLPEQKYLTSLMSTRNVYLTHKDGSFSRVDIDKFLATHDDRWNPFLREGDVLVVPRKSPEKNTVGAYGEVNSPGRFEYVEGDSIKDLLLIAQGFTRMAQTDSLDFYRLDTEGRKMERGVSPIAQILQGKAADLSLRPGDRVVVRGKSEQRADYRVQVQGEVVHPGTYPITRDRTRLSDIIRDAGGFTEQASLKTAEVIRRSIDPGAIQLELLESLRGGASLEDSSYYILETSLRIRKEIVNVDFQRLFVLRDSTADVILLTDDVVTVPPRNRTIYVFGQVISPGHVAYVPGKEVEYYVTAAGGFTQGAREGDLKVVKAKTRQWLSPGETEVEEGDYVWVPKVIEKPFGYYLAIIGQTAAVLSVALSLWILATNQ